MQVASMASEGENLAVSEAGGGGGVERKRKKTLGRRKIEIKPIASMEARHVCFSKRREGIYKKATELCAKTGANVAVVAFSPSPEGKGKPGGKPYSFGHPSVTAVVERYLDDPTADSAFEAPLPPIAHEFDGLKDRLEEAIAAEARRRDALDAAARAAGAWTDDVVRKAQVPGDLVAMIAALERVKDEADRAIAQQCAAAAAAAGACDACYYDLGDAASFTADEYGGGASSGSHQQQQAAMDAAAHMALLMGGNGGGQAHAPSPFALAPMLMLPPPDLPPPAAPAPLAFNYGSDHSHVTGYEGYAYGLGDGGAGYGTEGCYFGATAAATCNFFG